MPKQAPFFTFMQEQRKSLRNPDGSQLTNQELQKECGPKWEAMPKTQRERYGSKAGGSTHPKQKYTTNGKTLSSITKKAEKEKAYKQTMDTYISRWLHALHSGEGVPKGVFFILSILNYVQETAKTVPAEIGIVKVSIEKGIIDEFYYLIQPSIIPPGYAATAYDTSNDSHHLPTCEADDSVDYNDFADKFFNFIQLEGIQAPIYCMWSEYTIFRKALETLSTERTFDNILIYSLPLLLEGMFRVAAMKPLAPFEDILNSCQFDFESNTGCPKHQCKYVDGLNYCALGKAQRYFYIICSALRIDETYNIPLRSYKHRPGNCGEDDVLDTNQHKLVGANWSIRQKNRKTDIRKPDTQHEKIKCPITDGPLLAEDNTAHASAVTTENYLDPMNMHSMEDFPELGASSVAPKRVMKGLTSKNEKNVGIGRGRKAGNREKF